MCRNWFATERLEKMKANLPVPHLFVGKWVLSLNNDLEIFRKAALCFHPMGAWVIQTDHLMVKSPTNEATNPRLSHFLRLHAVGLGALLCSASWPTQMAMGPYLRDWLSCGTFWMITIPMLQAPQNGISGQRIVWKMLMVDDHDDDNVGWFSWRQWCQWWWLLNHC